MNAIFAQCLSYLSLTSLKQVRREVLSMMFWAFT